MNCHVSLVCRRKNDILNFKDIQTTLSQLKLTLKEKEIQKIQGTAREFYNDIKQTVYKNIKKLSDGNYFKLRECYLIKSPNGSQRDIVVVGINVKYTLDE